MTTTPVDLPTPAPVPIAPAPPLAVDAKGIDKRWIIAGVVVAAIVVYVLWKRSQQNG